MASTIVQALHFDSGGVGVTSLDGTVTAPTSGNLLIIAAATESRTFTFPTGFVNDIEYNNGSETAIASKISDGTEGTTITVSLSGTSELNFMFIEVDLDGGSGAFDVSATGTASSAAATTGATATTARDDSIVVAYCSIDDGVSPSPGYDEAVSFGGTATIGTPVYVGNYENASSTDVSSEGWYGIQTAKGTVTATSSDPGTATGNNNVIVAVYSGVADGGGGGPAPAKRNLMTMGVGR
jgi:hypothetical protein